MTHRYQLKAEHLRYYRQHPEVMAKQQFGFEPDADQTWLLRTVIVDGKHCSWRSGTGVGKTADVAILILCFMYLFPDARVVATSTKVDQLKDVLWPELLKWITRSKLKDDFQWNAESVHLVGREKQVFAVARTGNSPEAMQGFHADYLLIVADEASGIEDRVFQPLEGTLTGKHNVLVLTGNPTRASGYFFDSHHKDRELYSTRHTSSENHPRVDQTKLVQRMARKWGRDSDMFRTRVLGEFPKGDPTAMILLSDAMSALGRDVGEGGEMEAGIDVARFGDDRIVFMAKLGLRVLPDIQVTGKLRVNETVGQAIAWLRALRKKYNYYGRSIRVKVDDGNMGAGVTDYLIQAAEKEDLTVIGCNFGGAGTDEYDNWATWAWAKAAEFIQIASLPTEGECAYVQDLIGELTTRRKDPITSAGRMRIESKQKYKDRQRFSPDLADAFVLMCADEWAGGDAAPMLAKGVLAGYDPTSDLTPAEQAASEESDVMIAPMSRGDSDLPGW